jgi:sterol desaturase/sphingolipid hydroxylase (fatty acid hydroxylase superfamily)
MYLNLAAFILPVALLFMGIEYAIARKQNRKTFHFGRTISNLSIGAAERLLNLFLHGSFYFLFKYIYDHYALFQISSAWYNWVLLLFATDFVWYWYHRLGHEINVLWAFHIVHHQSEDYNLSTAARVTNFQSLVRNIFWTVLPFLGFRPEMVTTILVVHGGYSFFTHTEVIGKLGWLEKVLITPSHHRVHHASDPEYLDKNYGDIFVFWDKLFGTFKSEDKKPRYGLTKSLESYSFLWQHFHYLMELAYRFTQTKGIRQKLTLLFGKPEAMNGNEREILEKRFLSPKTSLLPQTNDYKKYIVYQLSAVLALTFYLILLDAYIPPLMKIGGSVLVVLTVVNCGALLEQQRWIVLVEYFRLLLLMYLVGSYVQNSAFYLLFFVLVVCIIVFYSYIKQIYFKLVYDSSRI